MSVNNFIFVFDVSFRRGVLCAFVDGGPRDFMVNAQQMMDPQLY